MHIWSSRLSMSGGHFPAMFFGWQVKASMATSANTHPRTALLMLNMGGPRNLNEVEPFLQRLFLDSDIIKLPMQSWLGPWIAKRRAPKVMQKYSEIGGKSPIFEWTERQGSLVVQQLDQVSPETAPHHFYVGFRYANPLTEDALAQIERDGVEHVVAFSQYAQFCCNTSGSSVNAMARYFHNRPLPFSLSFVDRWPMNPGLVRAFKQLIETEINQFAPEKRNNVLLLFTAHSLPLSSVNVGDTYPMEVSGTVMQVMRSLDFRYPYRLVWQSKVGPMPWQGPSTPNAIKGFVEKGYKNIILVPISFVNEHIETLHELDIEYCQDLCSKLPVEIRRCPTPNTHPEFIKGLVSLITQHLRSKVKVPVQLLTPCPLCTKKVCADTRHWLADLQRHQQ